MSSGSGTAHNRHAQIQKDKVGSKFEDLVDRFFAILGFTTNIPFVFEDASQSFANQFVVIHEEDSRCHDFTASLNCQET